MDGLSAAASIIAVVDISAKVGGFLVQYTKSVFRAKKEAEALLHQIQSLNKTSLRLQSLLQHDRDRLQASHELERDIKKCHGSLLNLQKQLDPETNRKLFQRLRWPFAKEELSKTVEDLARWRGAFEGALLVDQTKLLLRMDDKIDLSKLPEVKSAAYDSHANQHDPACLNGTRTDLINQVLLWTKSTDSQSIFWLRGMAGTGKSTISRTICKKLDDQGLLGASFFFQRGEASRSTTAEFLPTVTAQLARNIPSLAREVRKALETDPDICSKNLIEQWDKLIAGPFARIEMLQSQGRVIVVDALDECISQNDISALIRIFSKVRDIKSVRISIFLTSRPEGHLRRAFKDVSKTGLEDVLLHEVQQPTIKQDIRIYLAHELEELRTEHLLSPSWPGAETFEAMVNMASPLFIYAATMLRFIANSPIYSPDEQLGKWMANQHQEIRDNESRVEFLKEFKLIVGTIMLLANPIPLKSIESLLNLPVNTVGNRLRPLHSILNVPESPEHPVRLLHLSLRDFIVGQTYKGIHRFYCDELDTHYRIASSCLTLLSDSGHLKKDICDVKDVGRATVDIDQRTIQTRLPSEVMYACNFLVYHLSAASRAQNFDRLLREAFDFFRRHLLHWWEALSLMGKLNDTVGYLKTLEDILKSTEKSQCRKEMQAFFQDATRFLLRFQDTITKAPLQLYASGLLFAPESSIVRKTFEAELDSRMRLRIDNRREIDWGPEIQTLLSKRFDSITCVAFSPCGRLLAVSFFRGGIELFDAFTSACVQTYEDESIIHSLAFSRDGAILAGQSERGLLLWDMTPRGITLREERPDIRIFKWDRQTDWTLSFSAVGLLAISSISKVRFLDTSPSGNRIPSLSLTAGSALRGIEFAPISSLLLVKLGFKYISARIVQLWDLSNTSGAHKLQYQFDLKDQRLSCLSFHPDCDVTRSEWKVQGLGQCHASDEHRSHILIEGCLVHGEGRAAAAKTTELSRITEIGDLPHYSNSKYSWSRSGTLAWPMGISGNAGILRAYSNPATGATGAKHSRVTTLDLGGNLFFGSPDLRFSPTEEDTLAVVKRPSFPSTTEVQLFNVACAASATAADCTVMSLAYSSHSSTIAVGDATGDILLWENANSNSPGLKLHPSMTYGVEQLELSANGAYVAAGSGNGTVRIWLLSSGESRLVPSLKNPSKIIALRFSKDSKLLAVGNISGSTGLYFVESGRLIDLPGEHLCVDRQYELKQGEVQQLEFTANSSRLISIAQLETGSGSPVLRSWDTISGRLIHVVDPNTQLELQTTRIKVALSNCATMLACIGCTGVEPSTMIVYEIGTALGYSDVRSLPKGAEPEERNPE
ncbi:hypothetical protein F5Y19DRAFT_470176 [Xylariaceae sp. FL1651]|nr:hypothetical protein F5Y19DRAFT_470176 [Xylariaceae sp. FL1651]